MKRKQWKRFLTCAGAAALLTCGGCSRTAGIGPSDTKPEESQTEASVSGTEAETGTNIDESAGETVGETSSGRQFQKAVLVSRFWKSRMENLTMEGRKRRFPIRLLKILFWLRISIILIHRLQIMAPDSRKWWSMVTEK